MASKKFPLDSALGADAAVAVAGKQPMPTRPGGVLELGSVGLSVAAGTDLQFKAGAAAADVSFGAGVAAGLGIYDIASQALEGSRWERPRG